MNFFEMCQIETSLFNIDFAKQDPDWAMVKDVYDNNLRKNEEDCKIPKIIHFIWLGSELPEKYVSIIDGNIDLYNTSTGIAPICITSPVRGEKGEVINDDNECFSFCCGKTKAVFQCQMNFCNVDLK